ncbi:hypothetical protein N7520_004874 [Penicillium odoratum]|uniref:uncharacterized protein n=1 Tax=Penicillium odoratum TaxID=1167516 RepID=UPI0025499EA0|nr:uncharacterized protein N7520_004874 [Penicillium odoratum]KAJ5765315.1 hypothetical protein N7520_004874 [Penicillium odoratum]
MESLESPFRGLTWVDELFGLQPRWSLEPDIEAIKQTVQYLRPSSTIEVTFLTQGSFNKIYEVKSDDEMLIMRIALPVDPVHRTISEVATLDWIQRTTTIPVPKVITYESSWGNPIGFEWILMNKIPGKQFGDIFRTLSFATKESIVKELAAYSVDLYRNQLRGIGNIHDVLAIPDVGRIVAMRFFWGENVRRVINRGQFASSKDWLASGDQDNDEHKENHDNKDEKRDKNEDDGAEEASKTLEMIEKLRLILPSVFPDTCEHPEPSMIFHDDLSVVNFLVNDNGRIAGVLDWDFVSALPLWKACDFPNFLKEQPLPLKPDIGSYFIEDEGEVCEMYWEDLWYHEATLLRDIFLDEMRKLEP